MAMDNQKQFETSAKNLRSHKLFAQTNIFVAILKVALTGLLISLMSGIYIFVDQLLMAKLVPTDGVHDFYTLFGYTPEYIKSLVEDFNINHPENSFDFLSVSEIIKSSISISAPLTMVLNAIPLLAGIGAGILFTQAIAKNDLFKGKQIYKTSFYSAVVIGVFSLVLFSTCNEYILQITSGKNMSFDNIITPSSEEQIVIQYYYDCREYQLLWASRYTLMLAIGSIFNVFVVYYSFMIRAEGRNIVVVLAAIACNLVNIGLDILMISVFKMGMVGGGIATIIGWALNAGICLMYVWYLSKRELTWMKFRFLKFDKEFKFSWSMFLPIIILGLSVFLRNMSNAIANSLFSMSLNNVINQIEGYSGQTFQMLSGAVFPINNLFFYAIFGVIDGIRPLCTYCYSRSLHKRTKQAYYAIIIIGLVYGLIVFGLMSSPVGQYMLSWFDIEADLLPMAANYLNIQCLVIMFTSFSLGGLTIFQSTNRLTSAIIASMFQGLVTFPLVLLTTSSLALQFANPWILVSTNAINAAIASLIIFIWANIFIHTFMTKRLIKINIFDIALNKFKTVRYFVPLNSPKESYAQRQLEKH